MLGTVQSLVDARSLWSNGDTPEHLYQRETQVAQKQVGGALPPTPRQGDYSWATS